MKKNIATLTEFDLVDLSKPAVPLHESILRWVFFCPAIAPLLTTHLVSRLEFTLFRKVMV